jgi:hypothetical protein
MSSTRRILTSITAVAALTAFFLPWVTKAGLLVEIGAVEAWDSGFGLARGGVSVSSGTDLRLLFLAPAAVLLVLVLVWMPRRARILGSAQLGLAVLAALPVFLILPGEIATWSGFDVGYGWGLVLFVLLVLALAADAFLLILRPSPAVAAEVGPPTQPAGAAQ